MKGFKDSSKTVWLAGGYAKGGRVNGAAKVAKVMREFKSGELHSGSAQGPKVTSRKQATAIALSEAAGGKPVRKAAGGSVAAKNAQAVRERDFFKGALSRGNRVAAEEQPSEAMILRQRQAPRPAPRPANPREPMISTAAPPRTLLDRKLSTLPSQRGEMPVGKACGGLAAMPRGKK